MLWEKPWSVSPLRADVFPKEGWAARSRKEFRKSKLANCAVGPWLRRTVGPWAGMGSGPRWRWRFVEELL